jgi:uncharacterized membrane protein (DUF485 family)
MNDAEDRLARLTRAQSRLALRLTATMMAAYFGFILMVAYRKAMLGHLLAPGLSLGTLLGVLLIVLAWVLIHVYVRWANGHYDATVASLRGGR